MKHWVWRFSRKAVNGNHLERGLLDQLSHGVIIESVLDRVTL